MSTEASAKCVFLDQIEDEDIQIFEAFGAVLSLSLTSLSSKPKTASSFFKINSVTTPPNALETLDSNAYRTPTALSDKLVDNFIHVLDDVTSCGSDPDSLSSAIDK